MAAAIDPVVEWNMNILSFVGTKVKVDRQPSERPHVDNILARLECEFRKFGALGFQFSSCCCSIKDWTLFQSDSSMDG